MNERKERAIPESLIFTMRYADNTITISTIMPGNYPGYESAFLFF